MVQQLTDQRKSRYRIFKYTAKGETMNTNAQTSGSVIRQTLTEMQQLNLLDQMRVLHFILTIHLKRLNEKHTIRKIQNSLRSK
jgi:hypothetical protein